MMMNLKVQQRKPLFIYQKGLTPLSLLNAGNKHMKTSVLFDSNLQTG